MQQVTAYVYRPGYEREKRVVTLTQNPTISQVKPIVEEILGGPCEHCHVLFEEQMTDFFILKGAFESGLPVNPQATKIFHARWLQSNSQDNSNILAQVHGPALVFSRSVWNFFPGR